MRCFLTLSLLLLFIYLTSTSLFAQYSQAYVSADFGRIQTKEVPFYNNQAIKSNFNTQLDGWPKSFASNASFKNMRGACITDINNDGIDDIVFAANSKLFAYSGDGQKIWEANLTGTAIYPPAAADINNDGNIEIVQVTGGSPANGRVHVFDYQGNIMPGWPVSFNNNWIICSPALADLNNDNILEIIVAERQVLGKLHVLNIDGTSYSDVFPKTLDAYPAVSPSVAYYHNQHSGENNLLDSLIIMCSTASIFAYDFNGNILPGFPVENSSTRFSYQSPLICVERESEDSDYKISIIGATHGDLPEFYNISKNGDYLHNWPNPTANDSWTYNAPTALGIGQEFDFFIFAQPGGDGTNPNPSIHAFNPEGDYISGFPFERIDGLEGFISAMYSTNLDRLYIFTGSNMKDHDGFGFVHAYQSDINLNNFTEMEGFPIKVKGFTFMNGVNLGDINGNGKLDLVVLSYDLDFEITDSININVFEMEDIDYNPNYCFGTYKGNNLRNGTIMPFGSNTKKEIIQADDQFNIYPNPCSDYIVVEASELSELSIIDINGKNLYSQTLKPANNKIFLNYLPAGLYIVKITSSEKIYSKRIIRL